jgi:hypothetical protein
MDQLTELRGMIDRLLAGETAFGDFERAFGIYYYEQLPVAVMRSSAATFVSNVLEKLEFTTANPTAEERMEGWIDDRDFVDWLRHERQTRD